MNILLDTHILLWALTRDNKLPQKAIEETHIFELKTLKRDVSAPKHNDPFDRIMLAQSKEDDCKFITHNLLIPFYNEPCVITV